MTGITIKLRELLKNLKSDAVPKPPRTENSEDEELPEHINIENGESEEIDSDDNVKQSKKPKSKKTFFRSNKADGNRKNKSKDEKDTNSSCSNVNTQATGNVLNIVNSKNLHFGNKYVNYLGQTNKHKEDKNEPEIEKDDLISALMETQIKPKHVYLDFVCKNLGKDWYNVFRALGYTTGRIQTVEGEEAKYGVSEARYKLLLDWVDNNHSATLGKLATVLWEQGEKEIVQRLSEMFKKHSA